MQCNASPSSVTELTRPGPAQMLGLGKASRVLCHSRSLGRMARLKKAKRDGRLWLSGNPPHDCSYFPTSLSSASRIRQVLVCVHCSAGDHSITIVSQSTTSLRFDFNRCLLRSAHAPSRLVRSYNSLHGRILSILDDDTAISLRFHFSMQFPTFLASIL